MGLEFKLTDRELPASPAFIHFLARHLGVGRPASREIWDDQRSEVLVGAAGNAEAEAARAADAVMAMPRGRELVARAYGLLCALLIGDSESVRELVVRFHFVTVIGIPRTGGSYLTAELYRAIGMPPASVPQAIAHDSFPTIGPFELRDGENTWVTSLKTMAEYLTMVECHFEGAEPRHGGRIVVPKKLTQGAYAGAFVRQLLGERAEHILTVRHPAAACLSTYEKSGGLPPGGRFAVRSNIEAWCRRDLGFAGISAERLSTMDYFEAYLRYWELYHLMLAGTGLPGALVRVAAFERGQLTALAQRFHTEFAGGGQAAEFDVSQRARQLHPEWLERARPAIERVAAQWSTMGLAFPRDAIEECW